MNEEEKLVMFENSLIEPYKEFINNPVYDHETEESREDIGKEWLRDKYKKAGYDIPDHLKENSKKAEIKKRTPAEVFEDRKKQALGEIQKLKSMTNLAFDNYEALKADTNSWEKANLMRDSIKEIAKMSQKLSEIGQKDYFVDRKSYKESISKDLKEFKDLNKEKIDGNKKLSDTIEKQSEILLKSHAGNFARIREISSEYVSKIDKDLGEKFYNKIKLPKHKSVAKNKEKEQNKNTSGVER